MRLHDQPWPGMTTGVHFALSADAEDRLLAAAGNEDAVLRIVAEIEDEWDDAHRCEIDQSWDAIHRCLTDGALSDSNGRFPLNAVILGGRQLIDAEGYTVAYVSAEHALAVADALDEIDEEWFRRRYQSLAQTDYSGPFGDEDADDAWDYLQDVRQFYADAVAAGRAVIFTVDA